MLESYIYPKCCKHLCHSFGENGLFDDVIIIMLAPRSMLMYEKII